MICPECEAEYREGVDRCVDCDVALVDRLPAAEQGQPDELLVEVFRTADASLLPVVKSVLDGAGIEYLVQGDEAVSLFPLGRLGSGGDRRDLGAIVRVAKNQEAEAVAVLRQLEDLDPVEEAPEEGP